jgi:transposase-like protein
MVRKKPKKRKAAVLSTFDLIQRFPNEEAASAYIKSILWPDGPVCPFCGSKKHTAYKTKNMLSCSDCRNDYSIRTDTIFHRSHIPLHKWLYAMYLIVTARKGVSSLQLSKEIGVTQKNAWHMAHRIRAACGDRTVKLSGIVEADETYLGGKEGNKHACKKLRAGRGAVGKTPVFGIMTRGGKVIMQPVLKTDSETLKAAILENVRRGATLCTDESKSYDGMDRHLKHLRVNHSAKQYVDGMASTNSIESVWAILKRIFYGTHHSFSAFHTGLYVDECAFRLNQGNVKIDTMDRLRALILGCRGKRMTYRQLTQRAATEDGEVATDERDQPAENTPSDGPWKDFL